MYSNTYEFDFDNFQPLFIYIGKCRMFENEVINLDPRFCAAKLGKRFVVVRDENYCDLTGPYGIDIKVLCGKNGVGKTTILRILQNLNFPGRSHCILFFKDAQDNVFSTEKCTLTFCGKRMTLDKAHYNIDSISAFCGNGSEQAGRNSFEDAIVQVYSSNPKVYDLGEDALFDGFEVAYSGESFEQVADTESDLSRKLQLGPGLEFSRIAKEHPTLFVFSRAALDNTFDDILLNYSKKGVPSYGEIAKVLMDEESLALDKEILSLLYLRGRSSSKGEKKSRTFPISDCNKVQRKIRELSNRVDDWIEKKLKGVKVHHSKGGLEDTLNLEPFKLRKDGRRTGLGELSAGERRLLRMKFLITPYLFQDDICWFHYDDVDESLHPEWKRRFVTDLLTTYSRAWEKVNKAKLRPKGWRRRLTCVLVTHSPFILSDLMPQNIILLADKDGRSRVVDNGHPTFAGNIGELFHTEFFMATTIGEFARREIQKAIETLEGSPDTESLARIGKLFRNVGDEVLRNLLLEKLTNAENRLNAIAKR